MRVKTLSTKILLLSFVIFLSSLFAFTLTARVLRYQRFTNDGISAAHFRSQLRDAQRAYVSGGKPALAQYIESITYAYAGSQYYLLLGGRDLLSGVDYSYLQRAAKAPWVMFDISCPLFIEAETTDGSFAFIWIPPSQDKALYAVYGVICFIGLSALAWMLTSQFARPLTNLSQTVNRFGSGDLSARLCSKRRDEIGDVAHAFDRMADQIQHLLAAERRLLEDVSHELRSPLQRLSIASELMITSPDPKSAVIRVQREVSRLLTLAKDVLQVTRAEADPEASVVTQIGLDTLLLELKDNCEIESEVRGCQLVFANPTAITVSADHELLRRALENVLRNAIRYAPERSNVEIEMTKAGSSASICIRDYGPGVPEEQLEKIFDPFFRVDAARDPTSGGVGLGLAIAQRAIRLHGGRIVAENARPGLCVRILLPIDPNVQVPRGVSVKTVWPVDFSSPSRGSKKLPA